MNNSKKMTILFSAIILLSLLAVTLGWYWYRSKQVTGLLIADEIQQLADIFERIDQTAGILSFDYQKNRINFLNVRSFVGSEVGSLNLKYPDKWQGPYLEDNPTMQTKDYLVVKTKKGLFITPGEGVTLPNGKVIGKDIVLNEDADIPTLIKNPNGLLWRGKALAAPLKLEKEPAHRLES